MSVEITMPKLSDTMEEGTIIRWGVKAGDRISTGNVIAEVETDKAVMEMEAFEEGVVVELKVGEGDTVPVGTVIAVLTTEEHEPLHKEKEESRLVEPKPEAPPVSPEEMGAEAPVDKNPVRLHPEEPEKFQPDTGDRIHASPAARKRAGEKGISLSKVHGTGPGGRIVLMDVEGFSVSGEEISAEAEEEVRPSVSASGAGQKAERIRKVVAGKMEESWKSIPHFYVTMAVDVTDAVRFHDDMGVSLNDLILAAAGRALRDHPRINSLWLEGKAVSQPDVHVAFAVSSDQGLYSPVVRNCDRLSLKEIHEKCRELRQKTEEGTLPLEDLEGGTFTVSNMGMFGVEAFSAIITPPQSAVLAVGQAVLEPTVKENGNLKVERRMRLTLSADHRVFDGADGAAFLKSLKEYLEAPVKFVMAEN